MKFGKRLGQTIEGVPSDWRPFAIQYKKLKKCIHKIVQELDDKGISYEIRKSMLDAADAAEGFRMEYSFEANPIHIKPYIKFDLDAYYPETHSPPLLTEHSLEGIQANFIKRISDSALSLPSLPSTDSSDTESTRDSHVDDDTSSVNSVDSESSNQRRTMYVELETDGEFFNTLLEEISQLNHLQKQNKDEFVDKVNKLSKTLISVTSPYKKDMYTWREIFQIYLKAEIFIGNTEADRNERDWENAKKQLKWFSDELSKAKLQNKLKLNSSKEALREFLRINNDLVAMKQFHYLNKTATSKILKKHDKQTCLTSSTNFERLLDNDPYFTDKMCRSLCCLMNEQISSISPQLEDYTCPVCTSICWEPIRLCCGHVFCVRCLVKAERKKMNNCPICRTENAVYKSDLDIPLRNFLKLYFPREVETKRKENGKEVAGEELEILMRHQAGGDCRIM